MTTIIEQPQTTDVSFPVADQAIAEMRERYMPLKIVGVNDRAGYALVREARLEVKGTRCAVENRRKELKADALEWGRKVDAEAKRLTSLLEPIELHLEQQEKAHDAEKARIKREAEEAAQRKLQARVTAMQQCRATVDLRALSEMPDAEFDAALQAALQADQRRRDQEEAERIERERVEAERREAERLAEEERRKDEETRLAAARAEMERQRHMQAEREAALAAERKRFEAEAREKQRIEDERLAAERAELERQRKEQAAAQAKIDAENRRIADERIAKERAEQAERNRIAEAERKAAEAARMEALRPDREKLLAVAAAIRAIAIPEVSPDGQWLRNLVVQAVERSASIIESAINNTTENGK